MAGFTELIKNFDKIRDYTRDFFVYGYKCRNDYTRKSGRSYDNERRRIESYLSGYIKWEINSRGKNIFISTDTSDLSSNPLFSMWEAKSFTKNDCLLHFCLPDILRENPGLTAKDVTGILSEQYLSCFNDYDMLDVMTVRNKLNEYTAVGLFSTEKKGKTLHYSINQSLFDQADPSVINNLLSALQLFENVVPAGVLGYFIRRDRGKREDIFSFRHIFMSHTLDDEVLIKIANAMDCKKSIRFENYSSRSKTHSVETVLPLKIATNVRHGRRFLLAYNLRMRRPFSYRLDYIKNLEILEVSNIYEAKLAELENRLPFSWGVALGKKTQMEKVEVILHIDEIREGYVLIRLKREGKNGTVEKIGDHTFAYWNEVFDTMEMVPWLRTFIGRIISVKGSNKPVIQRFIDDIDRMASLYDEEQ